MSFRKNSVESVDDVINISDDVINISDDIDGSGLSDEPADDNESRPVSQMSQASPAFLHLSDVLDVPEIIDVPEVPELPDVSEIPNNCSTPISIPDSDESDLDETDSNVAEAGSDVDQDFLVRNRFMVAAMERQRELEQERRWAADLQQQAAAEARAERRMNIIKKLKKLAGHYATQMRDLRNLPTRNTAELGEFHQFISSILKFKHDEPQLHQYLEGMEESMRKGADKLLFGFLRQQGPSSNQVFFYLYFV